MSAAKADQVIRPRPGLSAERPPALAEGKGPSGAGPGFRGADRRRSGLITFRWARRAPASPTAPTTPASTTPTGSPASPEPTTSAAFTTAPPRTYGSTTPTASPAPPELTTSAALTSSALTTAALTTPPAPVPPPRPPGRIRRVVSAVRDRGRRIGLQWVLLTRGRADAGMSTAEYAVGTLAACGFAALLWKIVTSAEVKSMLVALIQRALKVAG